MTGAVRVGIIGPCPPPYGGVTRVIENHLKFWEGRPIQTFLIPFVIPEKPAPYPQTTLVDYRDGVANPLPAMAALPHLGVMRPGQYVDFVRFNAALARFIRELKLDVLYAHHAGVTGAAAVTQARRAGIPCALVSYGESWLATPQDARRRRLAEYAIRRADWVVSTSEHCRRGALQCGAVQARTSVIYAGIDLEMFRPGIDGASFRQRQNIPQDATVISILGLTLKRKLDTFLDTLKLLSRHAGVLYLIGGVGEDFKYLQDRVTELGMSTVRILGFVKDPELPEFYAATDVLVASPRTLVECMGQSMKEAMACARPVAGADIGGVPEAIENGRNGVLFKPDDPADLARALGSLIADPARRQQLGANAREYAARKFDARVAADQTFEVFQALSSRSDS